MLVGSPNFACEYVRVARGRTARMPPVLSYYPIKVTLTNTKYILVTPGKASIVKFGREKLFHGKVFDR